MKKLCYFGLIATIAIVMSSCATQKTAYTYEMYNANNWTQFDLKKMNFYLSNDITIGREIEKRSSRIANGRVKRVNGRLMEEITIKKGTVGTLTKQLGAKELAIQFNDCKKCALVFERKSKQDDRFILKTKGHRQNRGQVKFNGQTYFASANSQDAYLLIRMKDMDKDRMRKYEFKGKRVKM